MKAFEILSVAANALNDKKALDLRAVKVDDLTIITDYFLLATATSSTHVRALADEVEEKLKAAGVTVHHIEGRATDWILLDYDSVVIHIFGKASREFYALDKMWNEGQNVSLDDILKTDRED